MLWGAAATAAEPDTSSGWRFEEYPDPINRGGTIANAESAVAAEDGGDIRAQVRCWTLTRSLDVRFFLRDPPAELSGDVRWRFDRGTFGNGQWRLAPRGNAIVVPPELQRRIVRSLRSEHTLELVLTDASGSEVSYVLSLTGSARPISRVAAACNVALLRLPEPGRDDRVAQDTRFVQPPPAPQQAR